MFVNNELIDWLIDWLIDKFRFSEYLYTIRYGYASSTRRNHTVRQKCNVIKFFADVLLRGRSFNVKFYTFIRYLYLCI